MARASIRQVAELAGVSPMTVSRILRGAGNGVSAPKQERVMAAVRELDYVPVRSMVQNRHVATFTIGLILDDVFSFKSLVGSNTFDGLRETSFACGYDLLLLRSHPNSSIEEQKMQFLDRRCDGFIFVGTKQRQEVLTALVREDFPTVSCYSVDVPEGIAWVVPDNKGAMHKGVETLLAAGHRKIALMAAPPVHSDARQRIEAFVEATREAGIEAECPYFETPPNAVPHETVVSLIQSGTTAFMCHNDDRALMIWQIANEMGLEVPRDLSILGLDNTTEAEAQGLTTFINPFRSIGTTAVETIIALLKGDNAERHHHTMPMPLVSRNSVGPAPR